MFWREQKLEARIQELSEYRYRDAISIGAFQCQVDREGAVGTRPRKDGQWDSIKVGEKWEGRDLYLWLRSSITIPSQWKEKKVVGRFDFGITGGGHNSGFESLLYVNEEPYQGVDMNHQEVFFSKDMAGSCIELCFRLWSGLEGGGMPTIQKHEIKRAELTWLDEEADDLYFTAKAALETVKILEANRTERIDLLTALNRGFQIIDWSYPGSQDFYETIKKANECLQSEIANIEKHNDVTIRCIGHTHIDVAWLWRLKHTREKAARSFSTVARLMEQYPEYVFLQTQPQLYEYIKQDYPDIFEKIQNLVKEGRWEPEGGMWLEADCNISSGEALVRQLLYGTKFFQKEFGTKSTYLWLPDVFGYSWALPQILKKSGIDTFMTTKISWNQYNRIPHDTFLWRGIDGTEILTHFVTTPNVDEPQFWFYTYNGMITPESVQGIWNQYKDKELNKELLLSYGYGDGGGGVNREMLEMRRRLDQIPGIPHVKTGRGDEFFKELHNKVENTDQYVHTWDGELYLEYHRGTYTSQGYNKRMNRKLELLYREVEYICALNSLLQGDWKRYPKEELDQGWKIILRNQFHDILPGSSIHEVYEDSKKEYAQAYEIAHSKRNEQLETLIGSEEEEGSYTIFNSSPWNRSDLLYIPKEKKSTKGKWVNYKGEELQVQSIEDQWIIQAKDASPTGITTIYFKEDASSKDEDIPFTISEFGINTPYYTIQWNEKGQLTRIYDIKADREVLAEGEKGNQLQVFEDKPKMFDAWDIDIFYNEKMKQVEDCKVIKVEEIGPLFASIYFEWKYMNSTIQQEMIVYTNSRRIDFKTVVDWHEHQQLMKAAFPVDIRATEATYDIQFGNVKRPTHWNTSWDLAKFEVVGHQWADLSERDYGVSLLNDCKYGYDIKDNMIRLTLIKSGIYPDPDADQGIHEFTYALFPHGEDWVKAKTVQEAWMLNNPLQYSKGKTKYDKFSLFTLSADNVMIDAVKKGYDEDELMIRIHEFTGKRGVVSMESDLSIVSWQECNLMEQRVGEKHMEQKVEFLLKPYEIKTFIVTTK